MNNKTELAKEWRKRPHDINTKVRPELNEKLVHLTQVSSIAMRVKEREPGKRVFPEVGNNLVPTFGLKNMNVHVLLWGDSCEHEPPILLLENLVRWWVWWEKREFRSHGSSNIAHLTPNLMFMH